MRSEPGVPGRQGTVPLSVPEIGGNEWKYIKECLDTNWVSSAGSFVDRFEESLAAFVGSKFAVATINGTAALHIALLIAGVKPDDEVLVPALTFIAPVNAVRYVGAWPVFIDAEPNYWQMDPEKMAEFLKTECRLENGSLINKTSGRRVKAVLPVHLLGHPCDMDPIVATARQYGLDIIEDATESLGSLYRDTMVGTFGDVACFSFNGNKLITTGGGGMIVTNNQEWAERATYLTTQAKDDPIEYVHNEIGYNYRLNNIQAAMGVAQMEQIEGFIARKRAIAQGYEKGLGDFDQITLMPTQPRTDPTYWLYTILLSPGTTLAQRQEMIRDLDERGVNVRPLWHPINSLPPYRECQSFQIEHASRLYERALSLPSSAGLTNDDLNRTISAVQESVSR
jgi:perosamine synthetase